MLTLFFFAPLLVLGVLIHLVVLPFRLGRSRRFLGGYGRARFGFGRAILPLLAFAVLERILGGRRY